MVVEPTSMYSLSTESLLICYGILLLVDKKLIESDLVPFPYPMLYAINTLPLEMHQHVPSRNLPFSPTSHIVPIYFTLLPSLTLCAYNDTVAEEI